jgi:ATP-dependent DNA helicase RecG
MNELKEDDYYISIVHELCKLPNETEWVEFKNNNKDPDLIGEYISALSNSAALFQKANAYMIWGVDDSSHEILGTTFSPSKEKVGNEELENWLLRLLSPKIIFNFFELTIKNKNIVLLEIGAAFRHPVQFKKAEFIRIGSYKKNLKEYPEKERELWRIFDTTPFEFTTALENISGEDVLSLLDYPSFFDLLEIPLPDGHSAILESLERDKIIQKCKTGKWDITNMGAILFAKRIDDFDTVKRKAVRVIQYAGKGRIETIREQRGTRGYAKGFEGIIRYITTLIPTNEIIGQALRENVPMYPELAIRELVANALIHQDFFITGAGPMIEIFSDRIEITNPGIPLVSTDRFLDTPPHSRNEALASLMRRFRICEERGSGIDKVVSQTEYYQLPAPIFEQIENFSTRVVLFSHKDFKEMDKDDKVRACYLHACLRYVQRDFMTNTTLRERFGFSPGNAAMASRVIRDTLHAHRIRCFDENVGSKAKKYLPWWA